MAVTFNAGQNAGHDRIRTFESLAQQGYKRVYGLAYSMLGNASDAEDATQEAFLRAWRHLDQYDRIHPFQNWLLAIARNHIKDYLRRRGARTVLSLDALTDTTLRHQFGTIQIPDSSPDPVTMVASKETVEACQGAISKLHPCYRSVLTLHDVEGHSYSEIARILRCPLGTVRSRLHRGRALVRQMLQRHDPSLVAQLS
jgi:RNA polymerase sigma-70 factor (ECF subfamily)